MTERAQILLTQPLYDGTVVARAAAGFFAWASTREKCDLVQATFGCSLLGRSFNCLWGQALNQAEAGEITHFAMLHADIAPQQNWLDILLDEMERVDADILSVVSPIKDQKGLTSTGIDNPENPWQPERRFVMQEVVNLLPETFDAEACHTAGLNPNRHALLVNTGCWIADLRRPWWYGRPGKGPLYFTINDRMYRGPDGRIWVDTESEDWYFSRQAAKYGARVFATRKVRIEHYGSIGWSNDSPWGEWTYDYETLGHPEPPAPEPEVAEVSASTSEGERA